MKKVLLALGLVAVMATSSFAMVNLEVVGLLGGTTAGTAMGSSPLAATAVSFMVTPDISLAIGAVMQTFDSTYDLSGAGNEDAASITGIYVNGFYTLMQTGAVAQKIGLEASMMTAAKAFNASGTAIDVGGTIINVTYRADAKVLGPVSLLVDVELLSLRSYIADSETAGANTNILSNAKVGLSVPIM